MANLTQPDLSEVPASYQEALADVQASGSFVRDDGRIDVDLDSRLSKTLSWFADPPPYRQDAQPASVHDTSERLETFPLRLSIVIHVVGSRGDVQPFVALGSALKEHGHRLRLATHEKFRNFVEESGLEFFAIGGDPADLMAYMVKNPGLMPSMKSLKAGDVTRKREMVAEMLDGCWRSCIEPDARTSSPFVADAIIANPPSFAHIHCAEALGIPVHIVFTMPWSKTTAFMHPLANIKDSSSNPERTNYMTYVLVQWLTWQGLGDLTNAWRERLGLERVPLTEGPVLAETLSIPHTYCWSPALIPKPADWGPHIDVSGFFFRKTPDYVASEELLDFLRSGSSPIYIGFGSIVLEDTERFSSAVAEAVSRCGERAIISPGWTRLRVPEDRPDLFCLEECPHEWLFQHVSMVVHHGGAGTTAIGLREARPTIILPFFGDQPFWGDMVATAGAGPKPIPQRQITAEKLSEAIRLCRTQEVKNAAVKLSEQIKQEDGVQAAVRAFHANLPLEQMQCDMLPDQPACWRLKVGGKRLKLSRTAAAVLTQDTRLDVKKLVRYHTKPISISKRRWDPATGIFSSLIGTSARIVDSATGIVLEPRRELLRERQQAQSRNASEGRSPDEESRDDSTDAGNSSNAQDLSPNSGLIESIASSEYEPPQAASDNNARSEYAVAETIARASGKSAGKLVGSALKGVLVDLPLATAEGFRSLPYLWGEEAKHYGHVTDWQSGGLVAGKSVVGSLSNGIRDAVIHPVRGARDGGVLGAAKGLGTGVGSLMSGTLSAGAGVVAYPGQGIAKSLYTLAHSRTARHIADARLAAGTWAAGWLSVPERHAVVEAYRSSQRQSRRNEFYSRFTSNRAE